MEDTKLGGILGWNYYKYVAISGCYNTGNISGAKTAGGIVGELTNNGKIENCYNTGSIEATSNSGGICGYGTNIVVRNCYYANFDYGQGGIVGDDGVLVYVTEEELRNLASSLGENFTEDVENINNGYPILKWQLKD